MIGLVIQVAAAAPLSPTVYGASNWVGWASTAWQYYQPGVGVNLESGLLRANLSWNCSTDWDLGSYIYATIFARSLNLIGEGSGSGDLQFGDRINKILVFLQNRPLYGLIPFRAYDWSTGTLCALSSSNTVSDAADQGRLLSALHALTRFRPSYLSQVESVIARSQGAYPALSIVLGTDYYGYLAAEGFASLVGYDELNVFNALDNYTGPFISVYGQNLPQLKTGAEPLLLVILEGDLEVHPPGARFLDFANRVYMAQAGRYSATGMLTAWTEGGYHNPDYVYEWVVVNSGSWKTWLLTDSTAATIYNVQPLAYSKVALAYMAVYGENGYTLALVNAAKQLGSLKGFGEATFESGASAIGLWGSRSEGFYSDKTNEMVLAAAAYAVAHPPSQITLTTSANSTAVSSSNMITTTSTAIPENLNLVTLTAAVAFALLTSRQRKGIKAKT